MLLAGAESGLSQIEEVIVRDPVGKRRLIAACKELVRPSQPVEQAMDIARSVLRPNSGPEELLDWWIAELRSADNTQAGHWCWLGMLLRCWSVVDLDTVIDLINRGGAPSSSVITGLLHADRMDVLESNKELFDAAVDAVLAGRWGGGSRGGSLLQRLASSFEWATMGIRGSEYAAARRLSLHEHWNEVNSHETDITGPSHATAEHCARLLQAFTSAAQRPLAEWNTSTEPWDRVVGQGISEFGERPIFMELANLAAGIRSKEEQCQDSPDLLDKDRPMVRRARYARLRAGSRKWWSKQLQSAASADEVWMVLLFFATWAGARTIEALAGAFDKHIVKLETSEWNRFYWSQSRAVNSVRSLIKPPGISVSALPSSLSVRTVALLAERCTRTITDELYERYLADYKGDDSIVVSLRTDFLVRRALRDKAKWSQAIDGLRSSNRLGMHTSSAFFPLPRRSHTLPATVAREIVDQPLEFPSALVSVAEARCRQLEAASIRPVGQVAAEEGWFKD